MTLHRITLNCGADLDGFRRAVRRLIGEELAPQHVLWTISDEPDLFGEAGEGEAPPVSLPRAVGELIGLVVHHRDPERYALLYQLIWRVLNGERELLDITSDPLVHRLDLMAREIRRNLPQAASMASPIQTARPGVESMIEQEPAMPAKRKQDHTSEAAGDHMWDREPKTLEELNAAIAKAGPLVPGATQAVFGEGPDHADIVFVGEQPGDQEDLQGRPFVGPAGRLFDKIMKEAGIDRDKVYLTNAVKHFKFEQRGHRRIHSKPTAGEVKHYRPWLMKELELIKPKLVVALGGTALLALTGKQTPISRSRGRAKFGNWDGYITVHPSYLLRLPDEETKKQAHDVFLKDLVHIRDLAKADLKTGELPLAAE
ncbi:UdgX family uracil-DNA binding protein [Microvirga sp. 2TAF3]|uniref:UdgX family uracil-DNA binding protein n=1 Tax=Microvirga sp. 2TAF3 TaxID=3233014 RepID=UPI003F946576